MTNLPSPCENCNIWEPISVTLLEPWQLKTHLYRLVRITASWNLSSIASLEPQHLETHLVTLWGLQHLGTCPQSLHGNPNTWRPILSPCEGYSIWESVLKHLTGTPGNPSRLLVKTRTSKNLSSICGNPILAAAARRLIIGVSIGVDANQTFKPSLTLWESSCSRREWTVHHNFSGIKGNHLENSCHPLLCWLVGTWVWYGQDHCLGTCCYS